MGHEVTAEVVETGDAVDNLVPGDRVAVQPIDFCGRCAQCLAGWRNLCENRRLMGMNAPGAYAPYVVWRAANLYPLPDTLSYEQGTLAEPLSIALHAVSLAQIRPYDTAFIAGAGPIGLLTLSVLKQTGVKRIAVSDISNTRLEVARLIGAEIILNSTRQNARQVVDEYTAGRGVDIAFEAVGLSATAQQTVEVTRNKGTVVWIGNNQRLIEIDMQAIVTRELSLLGSYGMTSEEFWRSLSMLADGQMPTEHLINRRAEPSEGPQLFDQLLASPAVIKCLINFP
jgi:threonine dehydrogenase-like Zn-dependent dehydrogenase